MGRNPRARLLAALFDTAPAFSPSPVSVGGSWWRRLLVALSDSSPAFRPAINRVGRQPRLFPPGLTPLPSGTIVVSDPQIQVVLPQLEISRNRPGGYVGEYSVTSSADSELAQDDLESLFTWLREELDARSTRVEVQSRPPGPGDMGEVSEAVLVRSSAVQIARALSGWLTQRVRSRRVEIVIHSNFDGRTLNITANRGADANTMLPLISNFFSDSDD